MLGRPSRRERRRLDDRGRTAPAVVLEIAERGMAVTRGAEGVIGNTELVLKTRLQVEPEGEPAFEVEKRISYPQLSVPAQGQRLTVRYDPEDHDNLEIDWSQPAFAVEALKSIGATTGFDPSELLAKVREAQAGAGGDRQALAQSLRAAFGGDALVVDGPGAAAVGGDPTISALERLAALHASGALTDEEFAAQKARVLGGE